MNPASGNAALLDLEPKEPEFLSEVVNGLSNRPRTLPCKFFYDQHGAELFQAICELPAASVPWPAAWGLGQPWPDSADPANG